MDTVPVLRDCRYCKCQNDPSAVHKKIEDRLMLTYDTRDGQNYEYRLTRCQVSCIQILSDGKLREPTPVPGRYS